MTEKKSGLTPLVPSYSVVLGWKSADAEIRCFSTKLSFLIGAMTLVAICLPSAWPQYFGPLGPLISAVADSVPAIAKVVAISPVPEVIRGFLGIAYILSPVIAVGCFLCRPIGSVFDAILNRIAKKSVGQLLFIYLFALPMIVLMCWLVWELPGSRNLDMTPTRGQLLFSLMVSSRLGMATIGSLFTATIAALLYGGLALLIAPLYFILLRLTKGTK